MNLSFETLRRANVTRCVEIFHPIEDWSPTDWACAMAGECGEACNEVKKLRRLVDGTNTEKDPQDEAECKKRIAAELADLVIYADLLAARLSIDLGLSVQEKFDAVSVLRSSRVFLLGATA